MSCRVNCLTCENTTFFLMKSLFHTFLHVDRKERHCPVWRSKYKGCGRTPAGMALVEEIIWKEQSFTNRLHTDEMTRHHSPLKRLHSSWFMIFYYFCASCLKGYVHSFYYLNLPLHEICDFQCCAFRTPYDYRACDCPEKQPAHS